MLVLYSIELGEEVQIGYLISQLPALVALSIAVVSIIVSFPLKFRESTVKELTDWFYKKLEKRPMSTIGHT